MLFPNDNRQKPLAEVKSSSTDVTHEIRLGKDGKLYCTCQGWIHSKKSPKMCRHLAVWVAKNPSEALDAVTKGNPRLSEDKLDDLFQTYLTAASTYDGHRV